jgi:thioredoxin 1
MKQSLRITDLNFEIEVLKSDVPVLIDFWASWCPPCKMTEPIIDRLAQQYNGKIKIGALNVDQNPLTASKYKIKGVPTFILFQSGDIIEKRVGAHSEEQLNKILVEVFKEDSI